MTDMNDGRPCNTDVFIAHVLQHDDDAHGIIIRLKDWVEGAWDSALDELPPVSPPPAVPEQVEEMASEYRRGFDDGCAHIKEDYAAGMRLDARATTPDPVSEDDHICEFYRTMNDTCSLCGRAITKDGGQGDVG